MQLFNGLNMGMIKFYGLKSGPETSSGNEGEPTINYENELSKVQNNVDALKDDQTDNDDNAKTELDNTLTDLFLSGINNYLQQYPQQKSVLITSLQEALKKHPEEPSLLKLGGALKIDTQPEGDPSKDTPKLDLKGELSGIVNNETVKPDRFYSNLVENKPEDQNDIQGIDENLRLRETEENLIKQIEKTEEILSNNKFKGNEDLVKLQTLLANIKNAIIVNNESNVKILQKFISDNLDGEDKQAFDDASKSKKSGEFDGKFGIGTLAGLNKVLEKTGKYINSFKNQPSEGAEGEPFKDVKIKSEISLPEGDTQIKAEDLLENLTEGSTAEFKDNVRIDKTKTEKQKVTVVVTKGNQTREITITATVNTTNRKINLKGDEVGNTPTETEPQKPTEPLELNGKTYPVANDYVARNYNGVLYLSNPIVDNSTDGENGDQNSETQNVLPEVDINGDREYLMKMGEGVYKVKVDQNGNLKPLVENYNSGAKALLKNNESCMAYLRNKIPAGLPGNPQIVWNQNMEDYVIRTTANGNHKGMTIEPMEIDGFGVSPNLSEHLIMMNFVNFLRLNNGIDNLNFKNDNPDLKLDEDNNLLVRVDRKSNRTYDDNGDVVKNGKWYKVPMERFGLGSITPEKLKNLIKFNNHEDWNDAWDKKAGNKYYKKM